MNLLKCPNNSINSGKSIDDSSNVDISNELRRFPRILNKYELMLEIG